MKAQLTRWLGMCALGLLSAQLGCNNCEKLEEKMCADLGSDCEQWKELGKPGIPEGRGANKMCGNALDDDVYPGLFGPIEKSVSQSSKK